MPLTKARSIPSATLTSHSSPYPTLQEPSNSSLPPGSLRTIPTKAPATITCVVATPCCSNSAPRRPGLRNQEILFLATRQPQIKSRLQGEPFPPQFKSGRSEVDLNLQQRVLLMLVSEPMKRRVSSLFLVVNSRLAQLFFLSHIGSSPRAHYL
ncbi:hypothetical protein BDV97DRAFT_356834 [Delphinella strobiligena]|nr:hypothetical protein BDV97DRAFT_356834 [Delphinella strobiligena]